MKMHNKLSLYIVLLLLAPGAHAGNMVYNGSFELGTDGFALHRIITRKDMKHIPLKLENKDVAQGKQAIRIENPDGDYFEFYVASFNLKPETEYTFSVMAKTDVQGGVALSALIHDVEWHNKRANFKVGEKYKRFSFTFNTKNDGGKNVVRIWSFDRTSPNGGWKGNIWIDDISVVESGKTNDALHAAINIDENLLYPHYIAKKTITLQSYNGSSQRYLGKLNIITRSITRDKIIENKAVDVDLAPGECQETAIPLAKEISKYGAYEITVEGKNVTSLPLHLAVIGEYVAKPIDLTKETGVAINGGLVYRDEYSSNGKLITRTGFDSHNCSPEDKLKLFSKAGVRLVRYWAGGRKPTDWYSVEPEKGKFDFTFYDQIANIFEKHNIALLHSLGGELFRLPVKGKQSRRNSMPDWALKIAVRPDYHPANAMRKLKDHIAFPPMQEWENYIQKLAKHSKGRIQFFEFTNEPNLYVTPKVYVDYLKATSDGLKAGDPNAKLVGYCATSDFGAGALSWLKESLSLSKLKYSDFVSFHPYNSSELGSINPADKTIEELYSLVKHYNQNTKLMNTELYFLFDTDSKAHYVKMKAKAEDLLTRLLLDSGENVLQSICIAESMLWNKDRYQTYIGEYIPGELYIACNSFARLFERAVPVKKLKLPHGIICYTFRKSDRLISAIWNYQNKSDLFVNLKEFQVLDYLGNSVREEVYELTKKPLYIIQGDMTEKDYLAKCEQIKPFHKYPVLASEDVRIYNNNLLVGVHNNSANNQACNVGFNGGGYTASKTIEVKLKPNESKTVVIPLKKTAEKNPPKIYLFEDNLYSVTAVIWKSVTTKNGDEIKLVSADEKLSATTKATVSEGKLDLNIEVADSTSSGANNGRDLWETDSIELFLDASPTLLPEMNATSYGNGVTRIFITPHDKQKITVWSKTINAIDCKVDIAEKISGYNLHCQIPIKDSRLPIGFGFKVNDAENDTEKAARKLVWGAKEDAYKNRLEFGLITGKETE